MRKHHGAARAARSLFVLVLILCAASFSRAQIPPGDFPTGTAAEAWERWEVALRALLDREEDAAEDAFADLLALEASPFRVALLADRAIKRTELGGAVLLLEQDYESDDLGPSGQKVAEMLMTGRERMAEANDGWYFAAIGRFDVANANFRALIESDPDPVALLEYADREPKRRIMLTRLAGHPIIGDAASKILQLLMRGETAIKADPSRIKTNIGRLGEGPRAYQNALDALQESGEYAIPFFIQALQDPERRELTQAILRALPAIDRPALNPMVIALRMNDQVTKQYLIEAIEDIGYGQPVPYLKKLIEADDTPADIRQSAAQAVAALDGRALGIDPGDGAAEAFYHLADAYYRDVPSLKVDPRLDTANVWYWRDGLLQNVPVPTAIFDEVMCMRCCAEALLLDPDMQRAQSLWVAANFRRAAQLPADAVDHTRPSDHPSPQYFAQTAGPSVCLQALARAVDRGEPAVALGAIEALHDTAGPATLTADASGRLPLAEALSFPDRMVRVRAGLTLAKARPTAPFQNYQNLMPVLSEALLLRGGSRYALIVDPDEASANQLSASLREMGYLTLMDAGLNEGLRKVREELPAVDVIFLASDISEPGLIAGLQQLRNEFRFAAVPVVLISKPGNRSQVEQMARADNRLAEMAPNAAASEISLILEGVMQAAGATEITADLGDKLALEAAQVLHSLAVTDNPLFDVAAAQPALIVALETGNDALRIAAAKVLGFVCAREAQEAIAELAVSDATAETMRVRMFAALADAAKHCHNQLGDELASRIISIVEDSTNMVIREAASEALGALDLPGNLGSRIIRNQFGG